MLVVEPIKPRPRQGPYICHSPDANTVSDYFEQTGFSLNISASDLICKSCYDMHTIVMKHINKQLDTHESKFESDIELWKFIAQETDTDNVTRAAIRTVLLVASKFRQNKAILPQAVSVFIKYFDPCVTQEDKINLEMKHGIIKFSSKWLMQQLIIYLQPYMSYKCVVRKLGTLLYPSNADLLKCLTYALHDSQSEVYVPPITEMPTASILSNSGRIINDALHREISKLNNQTVLTSFSIDDAISNIDALLWEFISSCTMSIRERNSSSKEDNHIKKLGGL